MSIKNVQTTYPVARKDYNCNACEWFEPSVHCGWFEMDIKLSEAKKWVKAKNDGMKILKGQKYINVRQIVDGELCTFRARPEIDALCQKYEVYDYYV